jgi:hypothetical protein
MFKNQDRATQAEILRGLREVMRQLVEVRASVEALTATQAHILSRIPRPDEESRARVDEIREDMSAIRADALHDMLDRLDDLIRRMK